MDVIGDIVKLDLLDIVLVLSDAMEPDEDDKWIGVLLSAGRVFGCAPKLRCGRSPVWRHIFLSRLRYLFRHATPKCPHLRCLLFAVFCLLFSVFCLWCLRM
jgi:hypothetical protein